MGTGPLHFEMTAEEREVIRALRGIRAAQDTTVDGAKKMVDAHNKASDTMQELGNKGKKAMSGVADDAGKTIKQVVAFQSAVNLAKSVFSAFSEETQKQAKLATESIQKMVASISGAGDAGQAKQVRTKLLTMQAPGLGIDDRTGLYNAVRGALPNEELGKIMQIVQAASGGKKAGLDQAGVENLGATAANLGKIYGMQDPSKLVDRAKYLTESLGKHGKKLEGEGLSTVIRMVQSGMDPDEALGYLGAAAETNMPAEALAGVVGKAIALKPVQQREDLSAESVSRLAEIKTRQDAMRLRKEELRRASADDEADAAQDGSLGGLERQRRQMARQRKQAERRAETESMTREEFDLSREAESLRQKKVAVPFTADEQERNRVAGLAPAERIRALFDPNVARAIAPEYADRIGGIAERGPENFLNAIRNAGRGDFLAQRQQEMMADPQIANEYNRSVFEAEGEIDQQTAMGDRLRESRAARAYIARQARRLQVDEYSLKAALAIYDTQEALGLTAEDQLTSPKSAFGLALGAAKLSGDQAIPSGVQLYKDFRNEMDGNTTVRRSIEQSTPIKVEVTNQQTSVLKKNPLGGGTQDKDAFKTE